MKHRYITNERIDFSLDSTNRPFIISGRDYIIHAAGDLGGGTLVIGFVDGSYEGSVGRNLDSAGGFVLDSPTDTIFIELTGGTSPDVLVGISPIRE